MSASLAGRPRLPGEPGGPGCPSVSWRWLLLLVVLGVGAGCATTKSSPRPAAGLPTSDEEYARPDPQPLPPPAILGPVTGELLEVEVIDVGQGESILILPPGQQSILVDTGPEDAAGAIAHELLEHGIERIDLLITTHAHSDHIGGFSRLARRFPIGAVLDSLRPEPGPLFAQYTRLLRQQKTPVSRARAGMLLHVEESRIGLYEPPTADGSLQGVLLDGAGGTLLPVRARLAPALAEQLGYARPASARPAVGVAAPAPGLPGMAARPLPPPAPSPDVVAGPASLPALPRALGLAEPPLLEPGQGVLLQVLQPEAPFITDSRSNGNANTIVLKLIYKDVCMIFSGDAEAETEQRLLRLPESLRCPVLKVAHHGSGYSSTNEFRDAVAPAVGLISAGRFNAHGHPHPETVRKLYERGVWVFRTDKMGNITLRTDGQRVQIQYERTPEYWQRFLERKQRLDRN